MHIKWSWSSNSMGINIREKNVYFSFKCGPKKYFNKKFGISKFFSFYYGLRWSWQQDLLYICIIHHKKNALFRLLHPFLSASQMNDPIRQHWKTQSLKSPKSKNHLYKKLLHAMFMITVKIIFTVFWLFCWHLKDILSNKTAILEQQSYWHHLGKCFVSTIWHLG